MGISTSEKGVLKLVHPGRHVEIHREPITAAEVMRKNPRHCVARPDVFQYPWIVVRPESLLFPGRVFYIVPFSTIHHLLKAREHQNNPLSLQNQSLKRQTSPHNSCTRMTPKHQNHVPWLKRQSQCMPRGGVSPEEEETNDSQIIRQAHIKSWTKVTAKNRSTCREINHENLMDSIEKTRSHLKRRTKKAALPENDSGNNAKIKRSEHVNPLKSCLRNQNSVRKSYNLRVTFALPITR